MDWKRQEQGFVHRLTAEGGFSLHHFHERNKLHPSGADALLLMYFKAFCGQRVGTWRPDQIEEALTFFQTIPSLQVSLHTFFYVLKRILEMCFCHARQVEIDPLFLDLVAAKLNAGESSEWLDFMKKDLVQRQAGKTDLLFYMEQWRRSTMPVKLPAPNPGPVSTNAPRFTHPRACGWFLQTPISLLETWLGRMEKAGGFYRLQLPTCEDLLQRVGKLASPVRTRLLERAYRLSTGPVYMCWHDYGVPIPLCLARIFLEAPIVYYSEPLGNDCWLLQNIERIPMLIREAFFLRSPKILQLNKKSKVLDSFYVSKHMFEHCIDAWNQALEPILTRDISLFILVPYLLPTLEMQS